MSVMTGITSGVTKVIVSLLFVGLSVSCDSHISSFASNSSETITSSESIKDSSMKESISSNEYIITSDVTTENISSETITSEELSSSDNSSIDNTSSIESKTSGGEHSAEMPWL